MRTLYRRSVVVSLAVSTVLLFSSCELISRLLPEKAQESIQSATGQALKMLGRINIDAGDVVATARKGVMVIAQTVSGNAETIRAFTDALGNFDFAIPDNLKTSEFIISLVDASGRAIGPLLDKASQVANGVRSVGMTLKANASSVDFGDIQIAANGFAQTLAAVSSINSVSDLVTRVTSSGIPVGLLSHGKGSEALAPATSTRQANDRDQDGLIDLIDADDDGDGILDDFEAVPSSVGLPANYQVDVGFWLNPSDQDYRMFYQSGSDLREYVKGKYILEFWFSVRNASEAETIAQVALDTRSMPTYVDVLMSGPQNNPALQAYWSTRNYSLSGVSSLPEGGKLWKDWLTIATNQKANLQAGDLFNFKVTKKDGSELIVSQMLNFVFTNIPLLRQIGTNPNNLMDYTARMNAAALNPNQTETGYTSAPITIADNSDVTIRFQPPKDDLDQPIRYGSYRVSIIPYRDNAQVWNIDSRTWTTSQVLDGDGRNYYNNSHLMLEVTVDQLSYDTASGTCSLTIPKACFMNQAFAQGEASSFTPSKYSIGIVALVRQSQVAFTVFVRK